MAAKRLSLLLAAALAATSGSAQACKFAPNFLDDPAERKRIASEVVRNAKVIADVEVVRPFKSADEPGLLRAFRVLRGPKRRTFTVTVQTSCDRFFTQQGERMRIVLNGGPKQYTASMIPQPDAEIDQLLRSDRRRVWPYREGR